ncbi:MAG: sigma-54-dependent Fis family transcriptional regulator [Acidobacteria bacterium]|nr:sigma-54-dependent Fis family transcriptional regulator [Acidobacteriota bacterium]
MPEPEPLPLQQARADALSAITQAIGRSESLADLFPRVTEAARLFLPFDGAAISLVEETGGMRVYAVSGEIPADNPAGTVVGRDGFSPQLWPDGRMAPLRLSDAPEGLDTAYAIDAHVEADGYRSLLRFPLYSGDDLLGFQWFAARARAAFTEEHERALRPLVDIVTLALQHERLFRRERERRRRRELLDALLPAVAKALDVREVMKQISDIAQQIVVHDHVMIGLLNEDWSKLRLYAHSDGGTAPELAIPEVARPSFALEAFVIRDVEIRESDPPVVRFHLAIPAPPPGGPPWVEFPIGPAQRQWLKQLNLRSEVRVPLRQDGKIVGGVVLGSYAPNLYGEEEVDTVRRIADVVELAMAHQRLADEARRAAEERGRAERLEAKVTLLREELESRSPHRAIGESRTWKNVLAQATKVAAVETTVLLQGESGTGKEVVARFIHRASPRRDGPFVAINCAALPDNLLESELFGYERGAFTGALTSKQGRIEQAAGGVLFLDEVGETSPLVQAKLLRVLQEREFQRLGSTRVTKADIRLLAATNRDLKGAIARGEFREDLYYRLGVFEIRLPSLRERRDDILLLARGFLDEIGRAIGRPSAGLSEESQGALLAHAWPGNVRELRNAIERAVILCEGGLVTSEHLPLGLEAAPATAGGGPIEAFPPGGVDLEALEKQLVKQALEAAKNNKSKAARLLRLSRGQLYNRLEKYGLEKDA